MRIYAMSDIHGCLDPFEERIAQLEELGFFDLDCDDELVLLGDYIDRGSDSLAVVKTVMELERRCPGRIVALMGTHEDEFLRWLGYGDADWDDDVLLDDGINDLFDFLSPDFGPASGHAPIDRLKMWRMSDRGGNTMRSFLGAEALLDDAYAADAFERACERIRTEHSDVVRWMQRLREYYETDRQVFVHAGIDESQGEEWWVATPRDTILGDRSTPMGSFYKDVVAGHTATSTISGDPSFHGVFWDGESHFYIDGTTILSCNWEEREKKLDHENEKPGTAFVDEVAEALRDKKIGLEDVRGRFKDFKNSKCMQHIYTNPPIGLSTKLDPKKVIDRCDSNRGSTHCDGSGYYVPQETAFLYGLLWGDLLEVIRCKTNAPNNEPFMTFDFCFKESSALGAFRNKDKKENIATGDTLNSFNTTFNVYDSMDLERQPEKLAEHIVMLAYLTHSAGNLIPMPNEPGFRINQNRGCRQYKHVIGDYMDLTLECIRGWFYGRKDPIENPFAKILDGGKDRINQLWLNSFSEKDDSPEQRWRKFIDANYLQDYIKRDDYTVTPFFNNSDKYGRFDFKNKEFSPYPCNETELQECLVSMNARIIARNIRMYKWAKEHKVSERDLKFIFRPDDEKEQ